MRQRGHKHVTCESNNYVKYFKIGSFCKWTANILRYHHLGK